MQVNYWFQKGDFDSLLVSSFTLHAIGQNSSRLQSALPLFPPKTTASDLLRALFLPVSTSFSTLPCEIIPDQWMFYREFDNCTSIELCVVLRQGPVVRKKRIKFDKEVYSCHGVSTGNTIGVSVYYRSVNT